MVSVRLPGELEQRLEQRSLQDNMTKSDIIKEALQEYLDKRERTDSPYLLGEDLFGKYGSGIGSLSFDYKKHVREKIHAKKSN
ncbi:MAG: ribbon-helix-helix protein, CopG family [Clostridiales bacterium]|jgi:Arc/MetJ-type ribon-helix-helix transcriptional regulator|nr:ribbon-helix-helix protein, CopG family [Clostridiales bacterium]